MASIHDGAPARSPYSLFMLIALAMSHGGGPRTKLTIYLTCSA